jgi:hypothetical protein
MMQRRPSRLVRALASMLGAWTVALYLCTAQPAFAQPARSSVAIPAIAGARVVMLDVSITASGAGNVGGVVRLRRPGGSAVEVGRFSVFGGAEQSYQFNVAGALQQLGLSGGSAEIEVEPIDRSGGTAKAKLAIGRAEIVTR